jgi:hypothetical protein
MSLIQTFIMQSVTAYMEDLVPTLRRNMAKMKIGVTNEGINSFAYNVAAQGDGAVGKLSFKEYLRMVDMGAGKGHPLGGLVTMKQTLKTMHLPGIVQKKDMVRKPKKFYSRPVYGKLNYLESKLMFGLTDEVKETLKSQLESNK